MPTENRFWPTRPAHLPGPGIDAPFPRPSCKQLLISHCSERRAGTCQTLTESPDQFRLWVPESDPSPKYREDFEKPTTDIVDQPDPPEDEPSAEGAREFAFERDLGTT